VRGTGEVEKVLQQLPEVTRVVSRIGSPDVATDVMGIEQADVMVSMTPRTEWKTAKDAAGFADLLLPQLQAVLPGTGFAFTQPIEMRVGELIGGVQSDLGVKIFGEDLDVLRPLSDSIAARLNQIVGAADVRVEPTRGLTTTSIVPDPTKLALAGVTMNELTVHGRSLRQGAPVGELREGLRSFPIVLRHFQEREAARNDLKVESLLSSHGTLVPLGELASFKTEEGPAQVSREQGKRRVLVEANVRGRDLAGFVQEVKRELAKIELPTGYYLEYGGQYENLARASARLLLIVPLTLAVVLFLLYLAFGKLRPAFVVFMNVPAAATGGAFALALRGLDLSMSAAVGFLALFGVATLNGVVLMGAILHNDASGSQPRVSVEEAASERLRPVLTTALVAALGFLPMAIATGMGAEVQRPLATVVIGGLVTSTLLTLFALPAISLRFLNFGPPPTGSSD
jgi:cobalt-zinc-cadmium resistance protein CzcA